MDSVQKGLRGGDLVRDTYDRLTCAHCEASLKTEEREDEVYSVRACPDCGRKWKQIG